MLLEWPPQSADMYICVNMWCEMKKAVSRWPFERNSQDALWVAIQEEWECLRLTLRPIYSTVFLEEWKPLEVTLPSTKLQIAAKIFLRKPSWLHFGKVLTKLIKKPDVYLLQIPAVACNKGFFFFSFRPFLFSFPNYDNLGLSTHFGAQLFQGMA